MAAFSGFNVHSRQPIRGWTRLEDVPFYFSPDNDLKEVWNFHGLKLFANLKRRQYSLGFDEYPQHDRLVHWLNDLVYPSLLAGTGALVQHGGLIDCGIGSIGIVAPSGRGKSTLTGSLHTRFCERGVSLMGDDAFQVIVDEGCFTAKALSPSLRLFTDSLRCIFPLHEGKFDTKDRGGKVRIPFIPGATSRRLLAVFQLVEPASTIEIEPLTEAASCMAIISNSFVFDASDMKENQDRFRFATEVAMKVPNYNLYYPRDYDRLPEVHAAIFETLGLTLSEGTAA